MTAVVSLEIVTSVVIGVESYCRFILVRWCRSLPVW